VKWPTGTGGKGNSGVAAAVKQTDGAVGYVEQAYAIENNFTYAAVKNSAGSYELPTIPNTSAAAVGIKVPADLGISTINSPNPGAYPIVSQTFIDTYKDPCKDGGANSGTASALKKWLTYAFGPGQQTLGAGSSQLPYAPLPSDLVSKVQAQLGTMTCNGSPVS
jgi:phosphate transport system substrate-binding protein